MEQSRMRKRWLTKMLAASALASGAASPGKDSALGVVGAAFDAAAVGLGGATTHGQRHGAQWKWTMWRVLAHYVLVETNLSIPSFSWQPLGEQASKVPSTWSEMHLNVSWQTLQVQVTIIAC